MSFIETQIFWRNLISDLMITPSILTVNLKRNVRERISLVDFFIPQNIFSGEVSHFFIFNRYCSKNKTFVSVIYIALY